MVAPVAGVQVTCLIKRTPTPSTGSYKVTDWVSVVVQPQESEMATW